MDYLQLDYVVASPCGSGVNYVVFGPKGVTSCHEKLFAMSDNWAEVEASQDIIQTANDQFQVEKKLLLSCNKLFPDDLPLSYQLTLMLHGGTGCPISSLLENDGDLKPVSRVTTQLYQPILHDLLLTELYRRS